VLSALFEKSLPINAKALALLRGFILQNIAECDGPQEHWNTVLAWVLAKLGLSCGDVADPTTALRVIIDHTNVFILTEVMAHLEEHWRSTMLSLYVHKMC
jgi:hypothetical protein